MSKKGVFDIDKGWSKVMREMKQAASLTVEVGVQAGEATKDGFDMARLAALHEFGDSWDTKVTHYKKVSAKGDRFLRKGRFVKKSKANYAESFNSTITIPSRPFMRQSYDQHKDELERFMQDVGDRITQGKLTADKGLDLVGQKMTGIIQKNIVDGGWAPNAPGTKAQKGSSQPLIDTGRLRQSIRHVVKPK